VLTVRADDPAALNARLVAAGVAVAGLTARRRTLEQVVLERTGAGSDRLDGPRGDPAGAGPEHGRPAASGGPR